MKTTAEIVNDIQSILAEFPTLPLPAMPMRTIEDDERMRRELRAWDDYYASIATEVADALARHDALGEKEQRFARRTDPLIAYATSSREHRIFHALESWPFREE